MSGGMMVVREGSEEAYRAIGPAPDERASQRDARPASAVHDERGVASSSQRAAQPAPSPIASRDVDAIEALGEEAVVCFAQADVMTQRGLAVLAEFDRLRGWELAGWPSCADWLAVRGRMELHTTREKVRTARSLAGLPATKAAMAQGELSYCQVRELTRAATPDNEEELLTLARGSSVRQLGRMIRAWKKGTRQDEAERERERYESRTLSIFPDDEGGYVIRGRLTPEAGALLMRSLEAASDALFRERGSLARTDEERHREAGQRRADALELLAERALQAGFGPPADDADVPISGSRADRYQVVLYVEPETLAAEGELAMAELEDGTRVPRGTCRRLACDASVVKVAQKADGTVLDVGRKTRTIAGALRRALEIRDRGCRFPGCGRRFCEAHHVTHWADGGETSLDNALLLCRHHHRLVHEGGWAIGFGAERRPPFFDPRGHLHYDGGWQPPVVPEEARAALREESKRTETGPRGRRPGLGAGEQARTEAAQHRSPLPPETIPTFLASKLSSESLDQRGGG